MRAKGFVDFDQVFFFSIGIGFEPALTCFRSSFEKISHIETVKFQRFSKSFKNCNKIDQITFKMRLKLDRPGWSSVNKLQSDTNSLVLLSKYSKFAKTTYVSTSSLIISMANKLNVVWKMDA